MSTAYNTGSPDTERQLLAAIEKATVAQLGAGITALLVQAEQQVSHWCVLALYCAINANSIMLFFVVAFFNLSYS